MKSGTIYDTIAPLFRWLDFISSPAANASQAKIKL